MKTNVYIGDVTFLFKSIIIMIFRNERIRNKGKLKVRNPTGNPGPTDI